MHNSAQTAFLVSFLLLFFVIVSCCYKCLLIYRNRGPGPEGVREGVQLLFAKAPRGRKSNWIQDSPTYNFNLNRKLGEFPGSVPSSCLPSTALPTRGHFIPSILCAYLRNETAARPVYWSAPRKQRNRPTILEL